jgi:NADPH:quinone reductase-like Zn-dependent oxidoreductase
MKAIVYTKYGSPEVLQLKEVAKPTPKDDEVPIKVQAVSVNRSDWEGLSGNQQDDASDNRNLLYFSVPKAHSICA